MITSKFFKEAEFQRCSPSCSLQDMEQGFMDMLDKAREYAGVPFVLNSAYRSPAWEKSKGRSGDGAHPHRVGVDVRALDSVTRFKIVAGALKAGFRRIGIGKSYVHLDNDPTKPQGVMWHYYE